MFRKHLELFQVTTLRHRRKRQDPLIRGIAKAKRKLGEGKTSWENREETKKKKMEQGEKNWRVWSFGEDEKCQHVTLRAILLTCCQLRACTKGTTDGLYRKFEFQLIIKQEMKNTGYHTYTESPSENSDPYLLPRDKSGLWDRKGPLAFHKVL